MIVEQIKNKRGFNEILQNYCSNQFADFLYVNQIKDELTQNFNQQGMNIQFEELIEKELLYIERAYSLIFNIYKTCINELINLNIKFLEYLDPYRKMGITTSNNFQINDCINIDSITPLVSSFKSLKQFMTLKQLYPKLIDSGLLEFIDINYNNYLSFLWKPMDEIPTGLAGPFNKESNEFLIHRFICNLASLKAIIENMNQLMYQSFLSKQLKCFDTNNILKVLKHSSNYFCEDITLFTLAESAEKIVQPSEIIVINVNSKNKFARILLSSEQKLSFSPRGLTQEFTARTFDESIDPYSRLIHYCNA